MSTTATIEIKDKNDSFFVYCHSDGDETLKTLLKHICKACVNIDPNSNTYVYNEESARCEYAPNASLEAGKFTAVLLGMLWKLHYYEAYLLTSIDEYDANYKYIITMQEGNVPLLKTRR